MSKQALMTPSKGPDQKFVLVSQRKLITEVEPEPASAEPESKSESSVGTQTYTAKATVGSLTLPPSLKSKVFSTCMQYQNPSSVSALVITRGCLVSVAGAIVTTNSTSATSIASAFRLKRIRIWPGASTAAVSQAAIAWVGNVNDLAYGKDIGYAKVIPDGMSVTAMMSFVPPSENWASRWQFGNETPATGVFEILNLPAGSVVEVEIDYTLPVQQTGITFNQGSTSLGTFGYPALDLPTTRQLRPVRPFPEIL